MRGFWKTGKELSDRAEISRISSWVTLTCEFQPDRRTLKGGGVGLVGRNFRPDFPHEGKVGGGMTFGRFLSWSLGYEMHPSPSLYDHWNRRSLNIVVVRLFKEARVCLLDLHKKKLSWKTLFKLSPDHFEFTVLLS